MRKSDIKTLKVINNKIPKFNIKQPFIYRCSGYGIFPGGRICKGCGDCSKINN